MKPILSFRSNYVSVAKVLGKVIKKGLDFTELRHVSKVPGQPVNEEISLCNQAELKIDKTTIQLLERLALVNLDGEEALITLKNSIQFAKKIEAIDIKEKTPLYTVLEDQYLHLRADQVIEGNCREEILQNAKIVEEDYFVSPPGNIPLKQEGTNIVN